MNASSVSNVQSVYIRQALSVNKVPQTGIACPVASLQRASFSEFGIPNQIKKKNKQVLTNKKNEIKIMHSPIKTIRFYIRSECVYTNSMHFLPKYV